MTSKAMEDKKAITVNHLAKVLQEAKQLDNAGVGRMKFYDSQISAAVMLFGRPFVTRAVNLLGEQQGDNTNSNNK